MTQVLICVSMGEFGCVCAVVAVGAVVVVVVVHCCCVF